MALGEQFDAVLDAARADADWAWAEIYRDLSPRILGYLRANAARDPDDLLGEVFLQAVRDIERFAGGEREFRAWMMTIVHHRLLDARRYESRRPVDPAEPAVLSDIGPTGNVEEEAIRSAGATRALSRISRLSPDQRDVLLLRMVGDLTIEEVAKALRKHSGAVKALQRRGLASLKKEMKEEMSEEGVTL